MSIPTSAENRREELIAVAAQIVANPAGVQHTSLMLAHAITRAAHGWPVFPLNGKVPAIPNPHPQGSVERRTCKGECGLDGHGLWDATTDITTICRWWADTDKLRGANIGARLPDGLFVLDSDPRKLGHAEAAARLRAQHGPMPRTLTTLSGRLDGGEHLFYLRPPGKLSTKNLGPGYDIKTSSGYVVLPPSIHPDTGKRYIEIDAPIIAPPDWLIDLIVVKPAQPPTVSQQFFARSAGTHRGDSVADWFTENHSWADILMPHGWAVRGNSDPDADGTIWLHPAHTSDCSATIRHGQLFVWSTSTPFEASTPGDPHGYTRFKAYAVLNHGGEEHQHMAAAARALRKVA